MADVAFSLLTFGLEPTRNLRARVIFEPTNRGAIGPNGILVRSVVVEPEQIDDVTGVGVADLAPTTLLRPDTKYRVRVEWPEGAPEGYAAISYAFHVPPEGGNLSDLIDAPLAGGFLLGFGPFEPPPGMLYFDIAGKQVDVYGDPRMMIR